MIAQPSFSARLIEARRDGRRIAATDGPATIDAAYGCQADILAALGSGVAGWKVALPPGQGAVAAPLPEVPEARAMHETHALHDEHGMRDALDVMTTETAEASTA